MKQVTLIFALFIVCIASSIAQTTSSPRLTREYLTSHKWYPDIYEEEDLDTSFITYSLTQEVDSVFTEEGEIEVYISDYYLSDTPDLTFGTNKVGNTTSGKYLITERGSSTGEQDLTFIMEVIFISDEKMILRHLTEGYTTYGYTTTYYTAPFR